MNWILSIIYWIFDVELFIHQLWKFCNENFVIVMMKILKITTLDSSNDLHKIDHDNSIEPLILKLLAARWKLQYFSNHFVNCGYQSWAVISIINSLLKCLKAYFYIFDDKDIFSSYNRYLYLVVVFYYYLYPEGHRNDFNVF